MLSLTRSPTAEELLLTCPGVINFSNKFDIEIEPNTYTCVYINLEIISFYPHLRHFIIEQLAKNVPHDTTVICGIESGGSYYASAVANRLKKPLILLRKEYKVHDPFSRIVGKIPSETDRICLVDDVVSTGKTIHQAQAYFTTVKAKATSVSTIFSYGFDDQIAKTLKIQVNNLATYPQLTQMALKKKLTTTETIDFVNKYVATFAKYTANLKLI